jgi:PAS domain S-box-containing protein
LKTFTVQPSGREKTFDENDIIVSKTDPKGLITYANQTFLEVSGYSEEELLGQPHNIIRHPDMPQCVFKLLWDTIARGQEIFAYVKNMSKNGDHYWVFAHVTPTFDGNGRIMGYHSSRRAPDRHQVKLFEDIYTKLRGEERKHSDWKAGMATATQLLMNMLGERHLAYDEFVFSV